ncbi:hypothetical protein [Streptomyces sp. NPDC102462]|uniref:hypothetical protein n=1 Tax=Streptomyces sp. NPDC102462 TaxID=3366178 RepID=UPI00382FDE2F
MIVLPELLSELLDQVDRNRAAHLALDFAQHVLDTLQERIEEPVRDACREYLAAAHEAIDLGVAGPRLLKAHERLYKTAERWEGNRHLLALGAGLAMQAVRVGCQRMMEEARAHMLRSSLITVQDIARESQTEIGRWYAEQIPDEGENRRQAAREARWEETRWQVQHIIATEPTPWKARTERLSR